MTDTPRRQLVVNPLENTHPDIGRALWALEDARSRTAAHLEALDPAALDWIPECHRHSIGTLLYHIAAIEADWFFVEVLGQPFPAEIDALLTYDVRDEAGKLTIVTGESLDTMYLRLNAVRKKLLAGFQTMSIEDFHRPRILPDYDVTPAWVLHHLCQHEAEHRAEIAALQTQYRAISS